MADKIYGLSEGDLAVLKDLCNWWRSQKPGRSTAARDRLDHEEHPTPDVYIARTGAQGIPASVLNFTATGTSTGSDLQEGPLGHGECVIYRADTYTAIPKLLSMSFTKEVYNTSETAVDPWTFVKVVRDKYGTWWVDPTPAETCFSFSAWTSQERVCTASGKYRVIDRLHRFGKNSAGCWTIDTEVVDDYLSDECCECPGDPTTGTGTSPAGTCWCAGSSASRYICLTATNVKLGSVIDHDSPSCHSANGCSPASTLRILFTNRGYAGDGNDRYLGCIYDATVTVCRKTFNLTLLPVSSPPCALWNVYDNLTGNQVGSLQWNGAAFTGGYINLPLNNPDAYGYPCGVNSGISNSAEVTAIHQTVADCNTGSYTGTGTSGGTCPCAWQYSGGFWTQISGSGSCIAPGLIPTPTEGEIRTTNLDGTTCSGGGGGSSPACASIADSDGSFSTQNATGIFAAAPSTGSMTANGGSTWSSNNTSGGKFHLACIDNVWWMTFDGLDYAVEATLFYGTLSFGFDFDDDLGACRIIVVMDPA